MTTSFSQGAQAQGDAQCALARLQDVASSGGHLSAGILAGLLNCQESDLEATARHFPRADLDQAQREQELLRDLTLVLAAACALSGSVAAAAHWLRSERIREFDGQTAFEAIALGRGQDVCRLIAMYDAGPAG